MGKKNREGINFLIDEEVARKIVSLVNVYDKDVLEVGGGLGQLTKYISGYRTLTIIEKRKEFAERLRSMFPNANVIQGDALRVEWPEFQVFISNTPYSISTPLLERIRNSKFDYAVVTVQREVADRITASPGSKNYSRLTVMMNMKFQVKRMFDIPPNKFFPRPKVYSTVLLMRRKETNIDPSIEAFVRDLFSQRRKKIKWLVNSAKYGDRRPEELNLDEFLDLFDEFNATRRSL
ncbi:MAG: 16S rRNA (adenine(1518)-N(6)/adenine(1519)-N(6))-dimethyltransferase RsmA [Thermoplasmatales archaeon]